MLRANLPRLFLLALPLTGCAGVQSILKGAEKPTARLVGAGLQSIGLDRATLAFDVEIHNPYSVDLPLVDVRYGLSSRGEKFLTGAADLHTVIPAGGQRTVIIPATVIYEELLGLLQQVRPGQVVPYSAELALVVTGPGGAALDIPLERSGELPIPAVPSIAVSRVDWERLGAGGASGTVHLEIENTNDFPLDIGGLDYRLSLGGQPIASTRLDRDLALGARERGSLALAIELPTANLANTILSLIRERRVDYGLDGALSVSTPFGDMRMPFERTGRTELALE